MISRRSFTPASFCASGMLVASDDRRLGGWRMLGGKVSMGDACFRIRIWMGDGGKRRMKVVSWQGRLRELLSFPCALYVGHAAKLANFEFDETWVC